MVATSLIAFAAFVAILFALWWPRQREMLQMRQRIRDLEETLASVRRARDYWSEKHDALLANSLQRDPKTGRIISRSAVS